MKTDFKLSGLSKPHTFTCETEKETLFWIQKGLTQDRFNALFDYCQNNWSDKKIAKIEHDGFNTDGTPKNPVIVSIREAA